MMTDNVVPFKSKAQLEMEAAAATYRQLLMLCNACSATLGLIEAANRLMAVQAKMSRDTQVIISSEE